jgi:PAS domain S-box-containing protein
MPLIDPLRACRRLLLAAMLLLGLLAGTAAHAGQPGASPPPKHLLLLYAYGYGGRGVELFSDGFFRAIAAEGFSVTNVHAEYLDLQRNIGNAAYRQELLKLLLKKYATQQIDLIVTVQQPALDFLLKEGAALAPAAPVISIQHRPLLEAEKGGRQIVGEVNQFDIKGTLARAFELFPATAQVLFVAGSSQADRNVAEAARQAAAGWAGKVTIADTVGQSLETILDRVAHLPPHSIVIFTQYNTDSGGRVALSYEAEGMVTAAANAPVFGFYDYNLKNQGIGGSVIAVEASGASTGRLAMQVLHGGLVAADVGKLRINENMPMFDWQQIQRWGGDSSRLPANSVFVNRPPTLWQQYAAYIVLALLLLLGQSITIGLLLLHRQRKRKAEKLLRESEQRFATIFARGPIAIGISQLESGLIVDVNAAWLRMFAGRREETLGHLVAELDYYPDLNLRSTVVRELQAGQTIENREIRLRRGNGELFDGLYSAETIEIDGLTHLLVMIIDITQRKAAEQALNELNLNLDRRVQERTAELSAANRELDSFAYAVSHDLRAPLRAMSGFSQALQEDCGDSLDGEAKLYLEQIVLASNKMGQLIDGILTLSRSTRGDLQRSSVDLSALARRLLGELSRRDPQRQVNWLVEEGLKVSGDATMLEIALTNLLDNAWKYTTRQPQASIRVHRAKLDGQAAICVSDNGAGFDMAYAERLFQPFQRMHRQEEFPGIGVGLATVQRIVHRHGGVIRAEASPEQGASFCFTLPGDAGAST